MTSRASAPWSRRLLGACLALLLMGGMWVVWNGWPRSTSNFPPMPEGIQEPEVHLLIERARQEVCDEPRSGDAWGHLAMVLLAHLFDREADRCFTEAARLDETDPRWPYARALIALKRQPDKALPLLRQAADASEKLPHFRSPMHLLLAETLLERRHLDEAEQRFVAIQRHDPKNLRATLGRGLVAVARGDYPGAEEFLTLARASPNARKTTTVQLAALARSRGADTAELDREAATLPDDQAWPDPVLDAVVRLQVGHRGRERAITELEKERRFAEAAQIYLEQLKAGRTMRACIGAGLELARLEDYDRALPLLREGVELGPENAQAHYTLGLALFSRAEKQWQQTPGSDRTKADMREAAASSRRAAELEPGYAAAYLIWGLAAKYTDGPAAALGPLQQGVTCQPINFELQYGLGETLLALGRLREARTHLENAQKLDPKDPRPSKALVRASGK